MEKGFKLKNMVKVNIVNKEVLDIFDAQSIKCEVEISYLENDDFIHSVKINSFINISIDNKSLNTLEKETKIKMIKYLTEYIKNILSINNRNIINIIESGTVNI